jgi:L-rhamnose-H+ transport protein
MGNPFLGVFFHWVGGLASGSFYVPFRKVKKWSWETSWLVGGIFSWIICPSLLALLLTNAPFKVIAGQSFSTLGWTYFFGTLWGLGNLTFGLSMRYLGMSLGMGVALGYCAAFGTLLPPLGKIFLPSIPVAENLLQIGSTFSGQVTLLGILICIVGIAIAAMAGLAKEKEMPEAAKKIAIAEFNFKKGILTATFSGIMSACFSFALTAGSPIGISAAAAGTDTLWTGLPKLVVVLLGGFTSNFIWCAILNFKNRSWHQYFDARFRPLLPGAMPVPQKSVGSPSGERVKQSPQPATGDGLKVPMLTNYIFSAMAGTIWYFQFFFYAMGETQMGAFGFASWTLHMASIIIFSTAWGIYFKEWKGSSKKAHILIAGGIGTLILSTVIIGIGTWLKS